MSSVYKEKAIVRDQYPGVKVGDPSKTTCQCSSELCKDTYLCVVNKDDTNCFKEYHTKAEFWR